MWIIFKDFFFEVGELEMKLHFIIVPYFIIICIVTEMYLDDVILCIKIFNLELNQHV